MPFKIHVQTLSGITCELTGMESSMTIGNLKQQLEERWAIPVAFQSITLETQVLNNDEQLGNCSAPNATNIFMPMVVKGYFATTGVDIRASVLQH